MLKNKKQNFIEKSYNLFNILITASIYDDNNINQYNLYVI